jgi:glycosyltransferase involved in cell wall biosynthesis
MSAAISSDLPKPTKPTRILALCDSPALVEQRPITGFARVARNMFEQWIGQGFITPDQLDVWAISFDGRGYRSCPYTLLPAGGHDWYSARRLQGFIDRLNTGRYTHVWILMDLNALATPDFLAAFQGVCKRHGIRSLLYFPVDAPVDAEWTQAAAVVDVAVSYTEYGRAEVCKAMCKSLFPIEVVPHGVDEVFHPPTPEERALHRDLDFDNPDKSVTKFCTPDDFLLVSVNKNEWRKDPLRSLEILKGLRDAGLPAKMIFRMAPQSAMGGCDLESAARQLGLVYGRDWIHVDPMSDEQMRLLYGAADLYLTTTTGEGWGLGITEALACGTPVAMPMHTSCREIAEIVGLMDIKWRANPKQWGWPWIVELDQECGLTTFSMNGQASRLRHRVELSMAVLSIQQWYEEHRGNGLPRVELPPACREHLSWSRIAREMWGLLIK